MALPDFKIYTLTYSDEDNVIIPFIVSDELYYNGSNYESGHIYNHKVPNLSDAIEYFKSIEGLQTFFSLLPILDYPTTLSKLNYFAELYEKRRISSFTGNIAIGSTSQTISYYKSGSTDAYYRNSSTSTSRRFPTLYNYYSSGSINSKPSYDFYIDFSILPEECVVNSKLVLDGTISPQTGSVSLSYRQDYTRAEYWYDFTHADNVHYYYYAELNGLSVTEVLPPQPINFYAEPVEYNAKKGETVTPNFVLVYDNGNIIEPYTDVLYDESNYFKDNISTLCDDGISINISLEDKVKRLEYIVRPNILNTELWATFNIMVDDVYNPYYDQDPSGTGGGDGSYGNGENYFDTVGRIPNGSAEANDSRNGLYTRYIMTSGELGILGEYLWADELGLQVAKTLISLLYGDPVQTVISCVSYPFNLSSLTSSSNVSFFWGGHNSELSFNALNQNSFSIDWGTIFVSEFWGNFLDYSPHTQMQLYLPWGTGFVSIDPNDIMNAGFGLSGTGTLSGKTNVDLSRGMCVHNVIANNTVIGSYSGSCGRQIPITGSDYASKQVAMAGAAIGTMVAGAASAGLGAHAASTGRNIFGEPPSDIARRHMTESSIKADIFESEATAVGRMAIKPAIASAAALAVSPPSVSRSGSFQEGAGSLSIQEPYLIISRPKISIPEGYGHYYGYPSNITSVLRDLTGYTEVGSIHIEGIPATSKEIEEIEMLLKGGVIL